MQLLQGAATELVVPKFRPHPARYACRAGFLIDEKHPHAREIDPGPSEKGGTMSILDSPAVIQVRDLFRVELRDV